MKTIIALSIATTAAAHIAPRQTTSCAATAAIPTCGVPCITSAAVAIGCGVYDFPCQCTSSAQLQSSAQNCVISACGIVTGLEVVSAADAVCTACA